MKSPKPPKGYIDRGMVLRAYPTYGQVQKIEAMQPSLRACWNWLVSRTEEVLQARDAKLVREGLMPDPIPKPNYNGLPPEEAKVLRKQYRQQCSDRRKQIFEIPVPVEWRPFLSGKGSEAERLGMKQSYQVLNNYLQFKNLPELPATILRKLEKNFITKTSFQNRKNFKRENHIMPIQVDSGPTIRPRKPETGEFGLQRRCNFEVNLPSVGWIAVYLDPDKVNLLLTPGNTAREGCTLKYEHGRWYASIKIIRREVMHPGPGDNSVCGVDPGLDKLAAVSDGHKLKNPRNLKYDQVRSFALSIINLGEGKNKFLDKETRKQMCESVYRHDARQRRRVLTQCRQLAAKLCNMYDFIGFETNNGAALGIGSRYTGVTKTLLKCLINRGGHNRVREVESFYNSQICSQCGHHDKIAWERKLGSQDQTCQCPACGFTEDRDVNSARNVRNKLVELLHLC